jgi:hypothetical protein
VTALPLRLHRTELVCLGSGVGTAAEGERWPGKVDGLLGGLTDPTGQARNILGDPAMAAPVEGSLLGSGGSLGQEGQDGLSIVGSYEVAGETLMIPARPRNLFGL